MRTESWAGSKARTSNDLDVLSPLAVHCRNALVRVGQRLADQRLGGAHCHSARPDLVRPRAFLLALQLALDHAAADVIPQEEVKRAQIGRVAR